MRYYILAPWAAVCFLALCPTTAQATDGTNFIGYGPTSIAMGGTGTAYDIGPAGMMVNPATLVLGQTGCEGQLGFDIIVSNLRARDLSTGEVTKSESRAANNGPYYGPEVAFVCRSGRYAFGIGAFASSGVGTQFDPDSFLSRTATNGTDTGLRNFSRLIVLRVPVSVAYEVTDRLTVGGSLDVVWTSLNLGLLLDSSQFGALASQNQLSGSLLPGLLGIPRLSGGYLNFNRNSIVGGGANGWGIGGKIGATFQLSRDTRVGFVYNFKTAVSDITGNALLTAISPEIGNIPLNGKVTIRDFQQPSELRVGINRDLSEKLAVRIDYGRIFWSHVLKSLNVTFKENASSADANLSFPTRYHDVNVISLGMEYRITPKLALRGGFHYTDEQVPESGTLSVLPNTPKFHLTGGGSLNFDKKGTLDFALMYGFPNSAVNYGPSNTSVPIELTHRQIAASIALRRIF